MLRMMVPVELWMGRPSPLTIPVVIVRSKPKGFPMAMSFCPTFSLSESPKGMVLSSTPAGGSNFNTAMSLAESIRDAGSKLHVGSFNHATFYSAILNEV